MPGGEHKPDLVLGPLLRYVGETEATVWVETDAPCEVEILGRREPTFTVEEHHYALVRIEDLEPAELQRVRGPARRRAALAAARLRPAAERDPHPRPRRRRSTSASAPAGSRCPHEEPYVLSKDQHEDGSEYDALRVLAREMTRGERDKWPESLFLLGDQVYVDEGSPRTRERIRQRRGTETPPGDEVTDYEEYSLALRGVLERPADPLAALHRLGLDAVGRPRHERRLEHLPLLAGGDAAQVLVAPARRRRGSMSYWVYQHLGNLSPRALDDDDLYPRVRGNVHATAVLREFAAEAHTTGAGIRWSFCRDLGRTRVIFVDSRAGRVLEEGRRAIVDDEEWEWIVEHAERRLRPPADRDHGPLPALARLPPPRGLERAGLRRRLGRPRRASWRRSCAAAVDFDHWASFQDSFAAAARAARGGRVRASGAGRRPRSSSSPATSTTPTWPRPPSRPGPGSRAPSTRRSARPTATRSTSKERRAIRAGFSRPFIAAMRALGRSRRRSRPGDPLAPRRGPLLRQPGRDAPPRRARGARCSSTRRSPARRTSATSTASSSAVSPDRRRPLDSSQRPFPPLCRRFDQEICRQTGMLLCSRRNRSIKDSD